MTKNRCQGALSEKKYNPLALSNWGGENDTLLEVVFLRSTIRLGAIKRHDKKNLPEQGGTTEKRGAKRLGAQDCEMPTQEGECTH